MRSRPAAIFWDEDALLSLLGAGQAAVSLTAGGLTGNNVDLEAETVLGAKTELSYELALRAAGDRFSLVRTAIKGA